MRIQHNIAALNSHRQLTSNNSAVSKNLEKLSSGYRINRAGDDAAGLAISEKMRAQITGLETAQKNANDGISLVQTAEGALTEVHSMLNRMVELSEQSANGTYQDKVDRENLQKELVSLRDEIDRISEGTNFNGINLLDGSLSGGANGAGGLTGAAIARFKPAAVTGLTGTDVSGANAIDTTANTKASATAELKMNAADLNGKFTMTLDGEEIEIETSGITGATGAGTGVAEQLQSAIDAALVKYDTLKGTTGTDAAANGKIKVSLNNNGQLEFTNTSGKKLGFDDKNGGEVAKSLGISAEGKASSGGLTLQIGDTADDFNKLTVSVDSMSSASLGLSGINIGTQEGAATAIDKIKTAINTVSSTRGDLGALQNRLEHTINNLSVTSENMTAAESRIRDVDMAQEMMEFTKNNILTQASQSMLAQANQLPQGVLQLLQ